MNFKEFEQICRCYDCGTLLTNEVPLDLYPEQELINYKCSCTYSFKIPYDKQKPLDSFMIHLPITKPYKTSKGVFRMTEISIDVDTGAESFKVTYHSDEPSLIDKNKYFTADHIPDFMSLPKDQLLEKLNELLVFI